METYIAILRGINVSGQKMIKMENLKVSLEGLGLGKLTSYIQSGNLVFDHETMDPVELAHLIKNKILKDFGFEVPVIVKNAHQMVHIFDNNPFINHRKENINHLHVTFLSETPKPEHLDKIAVIKFKPDAFIVSDDVVYVFCPKGYGNTKISNNFFENKLKVSATTRNWNTLKQLVEIALNR